MLHALYFKQKFLAPECDDLLYHKLFVQTNNNTMKMHDQCTSYTGEKTQGFFLLFVCIAMEASPILQWVSFVVIQNNFTDKE